MSKTLALHCKPTFKPYNQSVWCALLSTLWAGHHQCKRDDNMLLTRMTIHVSRGAVMVQSYLWCIVHSCSFTLLFSEGEQSLQKFLGRNILHMNLPNYEITALCDSRLLHLMANLGSIPHWDMHEQASWKLKQQQQSTPHFALLDWHHETILFYLLKQRTIRILFTMIFNCPFCQQAFCNTKDCMNSFFRVSQPSYHRRLVCCPHNLIVPRIDATTFAQREYQYHLPLHPTSIPYMCSITEP